MEHGASSIPLLCQSGSTMSNHAKPTATPKPSLTAQVLLNDPHWTRFPRSGQRLMGFSRSSLYLLATEGRITTRSLKRHGQKRGIRFVHLPSLTALIENAGS